MAIKSLEQRERQKILLFIALGILIIAALILYFGFWQGRGELETSLETEPTVDKDQRTGTILEEKLRKIDLDFTFLTQTILPFLKAHGDFPVEKGETGRDNPFIHY